MRTSLLLLALTSHAQATTPHDCHAQTACELGDRSYHVKEPDNWDGQSSLPVMLHFHGWQRTGALPVNHRRISGATRTRGVLLIAPNGRRRTWDMWEQSTDDDDFADEVLKDAAKRWPIDTSRIYVSGYSYGSMMAWRYACESGTPIRALLGISGTLDADEPCPNQPKEIRHTHGLTDNVLDFPFGPNRDQTHPVALWRAKFNCSTHMTSKWAARSWLPFERYDWECEQGRVLLDVHKGGHLIPRGWIAQQLDELLQN